MTQDLQPLLSGLDPETRDALADLPAEALSDEDCAAKPVYTAERLRRDRPQVYRLAARLKLEYGMSGRAVCSLLGLNSRTLSAVVVAESSAGGFLRLARRHRARVFYLLSAAGDALAEKLTDPAVLARTPMADLVSAMATLQHVADAAAAADQPESVQPAKPDRVSAAPWRRPSADGLSCGKKSAGEDGATIEGEADDIEDGGARDEGGRLDTVPCVTGSRDAAGIGRGDGVPIPAPTRAASSAAAASGAAASSVERRGAGAPGGARAAPLVT